MLFLSTPLVRDRAKERSGDRLTALLSKILGLWSSCFEPGGLPEDQASAASQWQPPSRPHPGLQVATTTTPLSLPVTTPFRTLATLWTQYEPQIVALLWLLLKTMKSCSSLLGDTESWPLWDQRGALWNCLKMDSFADSSLRGGGYERLSHLL